MSDMTLTQDMVMKESSSTDCYQLISTEESKLHDNELSQDPALSSLSSSHLNAGHTNQHDNPEGNFAEGRWTKGEHQRFLEGKYIGNPLDNNSLTIMLLSLAKPYTIYSESKFNS